MKGLWIMDEFELAQSDWPAYFELLSAEGAGAHTSVRVLPLASAVPAGPPPGLGAQLGLGALPPGFGASLLSLGAPLPGWSLHACTYDLDSAVLELALRGEGSEQPGLRCFVSEPRTIHARESHADRMILILDAQAVRTLVCVRPRLPRRPRCRPGALRRRDSAAAARSSRTDARRLLALPALSQRGQPWS